MIALRYRCLLSVPWLLAVALDAQAPLRVEATLGVLADLARQVGGARVEAQALIDPRQDPHFVLPKPTLLKRARRADVLIELGMDLDVWVQKVADASGKPRLRRGGDAHIVASAGIDALEVPRDLSRRQGDVHPSGNPHVWLDPLRARVLARNIQGGLARASPADADGFRAGFAAFEQRLDDALFGARLLASRGGERLRDALAKGALDAEVAASGVELGGWLAAARPLRGVKIVTYHTTFSYLAARFGLDVVATIEEKPGITPTARHRERVLEIARHTGARLVVLSPYDASSEARFLVESAGLRIVRVPVDVGADDATRDWFAWMSHVLDVLVSAVQSDG